MNTAKIPQSNMSRGNMIGLMSGDMKMAYNSYGGVALMPQTPPDEVVAALLKASPSEKVALYKKYANMSAFPYDLFRTIERAIHKAIQPAAVARTFYRGKLTAGSPDGKWDSIYTYDADNVLANAVNISELETLPDKDSADFKPYTYPLFIQAVRWGFRQKQLENLRDRGVPIDTSKLESAMKTTAIRVEKNLLGNIDGSAPAIGTNFLYGITTHPNRITTTIGDWEALALTSPQTIVSQAIAIVQLAVDIGGPSTGYALHIPAEWFGVMDMDSKIDGDTRTIRERLLAIAGISDIVESQYQPGRNLGAAASHVTLVHADVDTLQPIVSSEPTTLAATPMWQGMTPVDFLSYMVENWIIKPDYYEKLLIVDATYTP